MLDRPTTTAFFPLRSTPDRSSSTMQPLGVQGMKSGSWPFMLSLPMLRGWKPSTSFSSEISASTFSSFMCLGSGSWTRMPWQSGSALKSRTTCSTSSSLQSSGISLWKETIPASSHALRFMRTYVCESGRLPTMTTARPGALPYLAFSSATSTLISSRMVAAMALPSMIFSASGLLFLPPMVTGISSRSWPQVWRGRDRAFTFYPVLNARVPWLPMKNSRCYAEQLGTGDELWQ